MPSFSFNINPLLLRELRQQVRNRFIIILINLYVAVLVLVCVMNLLFQQQSQQIHGGGGILFGGLAFTMGIACFITVVLYTALTTASERINDDLMFTSALKPSTIIFGKALAGAVLTILLMSMTAPFVAVAYLLRGLDIETVVIAFISIFTAIQLCNGMAICLCSNIRTKTQMFVVLSFGFAGIFFGIQLCVIFFFSFFRFGRGYSGWMEFLVPFLFAGAAYAVCIAAAVASIAPTSSNRLLPVRLTITVIYLGSLLMSCVVPSLFWLISGGNPLVYWVYFWIAALAILMATVVCERETWSFRIKRTLPQRFIFRMFLFPFYTGAANGLVWLVLLGFGIFLVIKSQTGETFDTRLFFWLLFSFDYCVTAMLIRSYFFSKQTKPDKVIAIILILFILFVPCGMLVSYLFYEAPPNDFYEVYSKSIFSALNPFVLNETFSESWIQSFAAVFWGVGLIVPLFFWFIFCVRRFSPRDMDDTLTLEQAIAAIREAEANPLVQSDRERAQKNNPVF
ncbi:MAG: ABC transporter permease [Planctomycetaceae bacterium]|nr:ABC transporter permease [Planctomycetaceae bacterium]